MGWCISLVMDKLEPLITILLGAFNGEKFLADQLDSIQAQSHKNWRVLISDDGSTDNTKQIILHYQKIWGKEKLQLRQGPQMGFAQNFLSMACNTGITSDYYAFCDQDDVWLPDKLKIALHHLGNKSSEIPSVYCGRTVYTNENLVPKGFSSLFLLPKTFRNALVQSIAGANTMVFNNAMKKLLEKIGLVPAVSHDWWMYQLVTGVGGYIHYDETPLVLYRQHHGAIMGSNTSVFDVFKRFGLLFSGRYKTWNDQNIRCLKIAKFHLLETSVELIEEFESLKNNKLNLRLNLFKKTKLYRQKFSETMFLKLAVILNKI